MIRLMAVDPGKSNGFAIVKYEPIDYLLWLEKIGTLTENELYSLLAEVGPLDELVVENFLNRPSKTRKGAFDWSNNHTSQVIGALRLWTVQTKTTLVMQEPAQKVPGYGYLRKKYVPGRREVHHYDALAHAAFRLVSHYKLPPQKLQWSK